LRSERVNHQEEAVKKGGWRRASALLALMSILVLAACGGGGDEGGGGGGGGGEEQASACPPSGGGRANLTFWSWVPGVDEAVEVWNRDNPNIQVRVRETPAGNAGTYQNMFNALRAGNAPDLAQVEYDSLPSFRIQNGLQDIGGCGVADREGDFIDWTWNQVSFGEDAAYAVPQDTGPMALYYRRDLFKRYGIEVPRTWEQYRAAAEELAQEDVFITHFPQRDTNWFAGLAWQAGARWFGLDGEEWQVSLTDEPTRRVAEYWQGLIDDELVATNLQGFSEQWNAALARGRVATWVSAVWGNNTITTNAPRTEGDWAVAPMPQWEEGGDAAGNWGGSSTAVLRGSRYPREAAQFALWLNTNPQALEILNREGGLYPATTAGLEIEPLQQPSEFFSDQNIFETFAEASSNVNTEWQWGPIMTTTYGDLADGFGRALNGRGTLTEALSSAQQGTIRAMQQQSLQVAAAE